MTKPREPPPARLEIFTVEQIEALARAATSGAWRGPHDDLTDAGGLLRAEEDAQFGELLRVAAYTGLRRGELVALRWHDVRWSERGRRGELLRLIDDRQCALGHGRASRNRSRDYGHGVER